MFLLGAVALGLGVALVWVAFRVTVGTAKGIGALVGGLVALIRHILRHLVGIVVELVRAVGALIAALLLPLAVLFQVGRGRWSQSRHYGTALTDELGNAAAALYRATLAHPLKLVGLGALLEGVEHRVPEVMAAAPGPDAPKAGPKKAFEGYVITGSLPAGGSGAKLWIAKPTEAKHAALAAQFASAPAEVVIKSFDLAAGSTLPQIVRENRALEAARRLGLVLEHQMTQDRFHYVMPYVAGADLSEIARRMHGRAGPEGLDEAGLRTVTGYAAGLLDILARFHAAGLWHKDIKPSNIIVGEGRVELVDLGLVTPLASAMTLTTHGTEYYRDPEMVRLAMRGVKVHEVDGVKFDLYSAGAVLYFLIEHSFPAHGSLSAVTKRCPEALRWIVRRAMASLDSRYGSAGEMLHDLLAVVAAKDAFALRPADLPSMGGRAVEVERAVAAGEPASWRQASMPRPSPAYMHQPAPVHASPAAHGSARRPAPVGAAGESRGTRSTGWAGVAVALGLFLAMLVLAAFAVLWVTPVSFHDGDSFTVSSSSHPAPTQLRSARAQALAAAALAEAEHTVQRGLLLVQEAQRGALAGGPITRLDLRNAGRNPAALEVARDAAQRFDGFVLGLLPGGPSPSRSPEFAAFAERLVELGPIEVVGVEYGRTSDSVELWAQLRSAAGLSGVRDDAAAERLAMLVREDSDLDGVLWYEPSADGNAVEARLLVTDPSHLPIWGLLQTLWIAQPAPQPVPQPAAAPAPAPSFAPAAPSASSVPKPPAAPPLPPSPASTSAKAGSGPRR